MPTFTFTSPDGKSYSVEGPEGSTQEQAFQILQKQISGAPAPAEKPSVLSDVAKSAGIGVAKGAIGLAGMVGDLNNLITAGSDYIAGKIASPEYVKKVQEIRGAIRSPISQPSSQEIQRSVEGVTGGFYKPQTTAGKYAESVGTMVPAVAMGPGGILRKAGQALGSGLGSEGAGQLTSGTAAEPYARVAGALIGGALPDVGRRIVTPNAISPERQRLLETLNQEGVNSLTAGQRTGNKTLQYAESILGDAPGAGQGATRIQQEGQRQFTEAAMRRAGAGPNAAPEVLANNSTRLGQEFSDLAARNNIVFDQQFGQDVNSAIRSYMRVPPSQQRAVVENYVQDIIGHAQNGQMPGALYQEMRSRLSRQANGLRNSDPTLSEALRDLRNALDNNMRRSISPADRQAWDTARRQYGAQKVLEKSASRAGEATAEGQIVPANLRNTVAAENRGAYSRGHGDFSELARAGSGVMAPLPNSGTGQRVAINTIATLLGGGAGSMTGGAGAMAGVAAGAAAPGIAGRALMSRPVQSYLGNQLIGQPGARVRDYARISKVLNALLAAPR